MTRRTTYRVAGQPLLVEAQDAWSAQAIDALFAGWYLEQERAPAHVPASPAIVMRSAAKPAPIPPGLQAFEIDGGGTCYSDGGASYIDLDGSIVAIGDSGLAAIEVSTNGPLAMDAPVLTRVVAYALSAALRRRRLFELHSAALVDPETGKGLLIVGPSGSGKSTLTVHLAAAGWLFLTDDVLVLREDAGQVDAWPLRRCFAITSDTFAASRYLQSHAALDGVDFHDGDKTPFAPHDVFTAEFSNRCVPGTVFFSELSGEHYSQVARLSAGDVLARLIRMSPWSCYDRATAVEHLSVLSALARQSAGYALLAGRDLLDPETSVAMVATYTRE